MSTPVTCIFCHHFDCFCACLQEMSVGYANGIRVMSMTHTGEPGFMLYIPIEVSSRLHTPKTCLIKDFFNKCDLLYITNIITSVSTVRPARVQ